MQPTRVATASTRPTPRRRRAMTLIEVLVATVLLGVGVTGLLSATTLGMRNQQRAEQRAVALGLAQSKLAEVEAIGPQVWTLGHPTQGREPIGGAVYEWTIQIEPLSAGQLFAVDVNVSWNAASRGGSVHLQTWLNDYEATALTNREDRQAPPMPNAESSNQR